jgi:hypothetical protein
MAITVLTVERTPNNFNRTIEGEEKTRRLDGSERHSAEMTKKQKNLRMMAIIFCEIILLSPALETSSMWVRPLTARGKQPQTKPAPDSITSATQKQNHHSSSTLH